MNHDNNVTELRPTSVRSEDPPAYGDGDLGIDMDAFSQDGHAKIEALTMIARRAGDAGR